MITDVNDQAGSAIAADLGGLFIHLDVTDDNAWADVIAATEEALGRVNVLVNNAGISSAAVADDPFDPLSDKAFRRVLDVNLIGSFLGIRHAVPAMQRAGGGSIVNVSSAAGLVGVVGDLGYTASKFGVRGLTKSAALTYAKESIRVNSVHPGVIRTPLLDGVDQDVALQTTPVGRLGEPEEVANLVVYLASDESSFSTGSEFIVDGGWSAI